MLSHIPSPIRSLARGYSWLGNIVGKGGGTIYRLHHPEKPILFLKYGRAAAAYDITNEMARLRWLASRTSVPEVRYFVTTGDEAWLLMTGLPGLNAHQLLNENDVDPVAIVDVISRFLRRLHSLPVEECPFNSGHQIRLIEARKRLEAGVVDVSSFDHQHRGWSAEEVWRQMMRYVPMTPSPVITHGDFSLENILIEEGRVSGVIDVARAGIADAYQDLAILWNCLGDFDCALRTRLHLSYGITGFEEEKLRFHLALDEFF